MIKKFFTLLCLCTLCIGSAWGAEGDTHLIGGVIFEQVLDNNAQISDVVITNPGYPVKEVVLNCRYSGNRGSVYIYIIIGGKIFGEGQSFNSVTPKDIKFTGEAKNGDIIIKFENRSGVVTGNVTFWLDRVTLTEGASTPAQTLQSIAISGSPTKTTYNEGETFDPAGLKVTGTYEDKSTKEITDGITWSFDPETLTVGTTSVSVTATVLGKTSPAYVVNGLTVTAVPKYTVQFSVNGVVTTSEEKCAGEPVVFPKVSSIAGYTFMGWTSNPIDGKQDEAPELLTNVQQPADNDALYFAVFAKQNGSGGKTTVTLTNETIAKNRTGSTSYEERDIEGWTGKYLINLRTGVYYLQLGRGSSSSSSSYNSHLTTPSSTKTIKSITINTNNNTSSGRTFYLCATDDLGSAVAGDAVYGSGSISEAEGSVTIDVTNSPTQVHIYPDGTAYIESVSVTYNNKSYSDYTTFVGYTREGLTSGNLGSVCLPCAADVEGATLYEISAITMDDVNTNYIKSISFSSVESAEAGKGYVFKASDSKLIAYYSGTAVENVVANNGIIGNLSAEKQTVAATQYIISGNTVKRSNGTATVGQNRAYIDPAQFTATSKTADFTIEFDTPTAINEVFDKINAEGQWYSIKGEKVARPTTGVFVKNGVKYIFK